MSENTDGASSDGAEEKTTYLLPNYTQWFDLNAVNAIEKECVPNIFLGYAQNSNAMMEEYMRIRNKIVLLYRDDPDYYLTVTYCVRKLAYDASIIMKIHSFLNYWGIINYQVVNSRGDRLNKKRIKEETLELRGIHSGSRAKKTKKSNLEEVFKKIGKTKDNYLSSVQETFNKSSEANASSEDKMVYPLCCGCNSECKSSYYVLGPDTIGEVMPHIMTKGIWCTSCYCNSNYPITFNKDYFVRIDIPPKFSEKLLNVCQNRSGDDLNDSRFLDNEIIISRSSSSSARGKSFCDQEFEDNAPEGTSNKEDDRKKKEESQNSEYEKLYEAIRKYGTDWQSVAQHLGDDITPNEVIFQFINAPLEREVISNLKLTNYMEPSVYDKIKPNFPFLDSPNTIISLLSFCASVISPVVASSAAKVAFDTILNSLKNLSKLKKGNGKNVQFTSEGADNAKEDYEDVNKSNEDLDSEEVTVLDNESENKGVDSSQEQKSGSEEQEEMRRSDKEEDVEVLELEEESEKKDKKEMPIDKYINKMILQKAAHAALEAARERSAELATQENQLLKQALPRLISLKIGRIKEKLKIYNQTQDKLNRRRLKMSRKALKILECKFK